MNGHPLTRLQLERVGDRTRLTGHLAQMKKEGVPGPVRPRIRGPSGGRKPPRELGALPIGGLSPPAPQPGGLTGPPVPPFFLPLAYGVP